ncbi:MULTISPECIES: recombination regulator RecX [Enterococcus]|uniref:recombination regulator RecX n=1 Tax=Enterococcus TaxID=1350 RepID=UPI0010F7C0E8|nr:MULTISPECIES: recombination regulator RecX [Enterococcus]KAF1303851.1 recombination regulator RecX [Enterococcus sp. JM9B]
MITIVRISKGKGNFYKVEFSNGEALRVSEDLLVRYRLLKGMELSEEEFQKVKKSTGYDLGLQLAMNYISYQLRSEKEVRSYLKEKEIEAHDRDTILQRLKELKVVDDRVYGESYVRTQMRTSDKGPTVVKQQLRLKGLSEDLIEEVLHLYTFDQQLEVAKHVAEKSLRRIHGKSHKETIQKIRTALMQKGFSGDSISLTMEDLALEKESDEEYDALVKEGERLWRRHQRKAQRERENKVKQGLFQKGFQLDEIQRFLEEKGLEDD